MLVLLKELKRRTCCQRRILCEMELKRSAAAVNMNDVDLKINMNDVDLKISRNESVTGTFENVTYRWKVEQVKDPQSGGLLGNVSVVLGKRVDLLNSSER